jgi:hypothetical protein
MMKTCSKLLGGSTLPHGRVKVLSAQESIDQWTDTLDDQSMAQLILKEEALEGMLTIVRSKMTQWQDMYEALGND